MCKFLNHSKIIVVSSPNSFILQQTMVFHIKHNILNRYLDPDVHLLLAEELNAQHLTNKFQRLNQAIATVVRPSTHLLYMVSGRIEPYTNWLLAPYTNSDPGPTLKLPTRAL